MSVALLALVAGCKAERPSAPKERGHDPWVIRATLDERPRMLVLALARDLWVAYDTERAALYRVAGSGVNFDGAVYNTHHGPQPVTQGGVLLTSAFALPWHLVRGGSDLRPTVQYRGHRFEAGQVVLRYTLSLAKPAVDVTVEERPEVVRDDDGHATLERRFRVLALPADLSVVMDFNAPRLASTDDITLVTKGDEITGKLTLRRDAETRAIFAFSKPNDAPIDRAAAAQPAGQRLIAESDCATCHNPVSKTIGPSYKEIAERYQTNPDTILGLAKKIQQGGSFQWGEAAMVAHPNLSVDDASTIAKYILETFDPANEKGEERTHPLTAVYAQRDDFDARKLTPGITVALYEIGHPLDALPTVAPDTIPNELFTASSLRFERMEDFRRRAPSTAFIVRARGWLEVDEDGDYDFRVDHDGIAELSIDEWALVRDVPARARRTSPWVSIALTKGLHPIDVTYVTSATSPAFALRWEPPNGKEEVVPARAFKGLAPKDARTEDGLKSYALAEGVPGRGKPLTAVHPSFAVRSLRPHDFKPMVGGIDFLGPKKAVISTWDGRGAVYRLENLDAEDPEQIQVTRIAEGLNEPLGLKVVNGQIYVMQKHELTRLVDHDGDGLIEDYQTVSNGWGATGNFHEFAFGLDHRDGHFYATLAIGIEPGGAAMNPQNKDRGKVVRIAEQTGAIEYVARGLRTPNGVGFGVDGELFVTDNEGDWLPANKLIHVQKGAFYGCYSVAPDETRDLPVTPPAVWLPVDEIANSPSQPLPLNVGPYQNQMLYADVTYGGLNRVVLHQVDGHYQGCTLPFTQGFEAGINRAVTGPDGDIYVGGIGNPGNWAQEHKLWYGLERLRYTGAPAFEMLDLAVRSDGIEITFTEPLRAGDGDAPSDYALSAWRYQPTADYGGPKIDEHLVPVRAVHVSKDRRRVFLAVSDLKTGHVVRVNLAEAPLAESGRAVWSTDAYCTVNHIPKDQPGERHDGASAPRPNTLSEAERAAGFRLLFDGRSLTGWRGYKKASATTSWRVRDGWLATEGARGVDLITDDEFADFELELEWRVEKGGNGGIFYRAGEDAEALFLAGAEMQVLDDDAHPDGRAPLHRAGAVYDLFAPNARVVKKAGEINRARIVARGTRIEHWLNGHLVAAYDTESPDFVRQVADSKFKDVPGFGARARGHIGLQHHGDPVWYRNIKLRPLSPSP